ncbi:hypothetical protein OG711_19240 [Streptomyces uncialis]|uniref:hypothetical protein n=1 Tax=Streptomyces uncialis TaxID=1048205 RepID=UPI002E3578E5|nr:hypothetical protein [Streptomyces uncialis]
MPWTWRRHRDQGPENDRDDRDRAGEQDFVTLSAELTGFTAEELYATGLVTEYRELVAREAGPDNYARLVGGEPHTVPELVRAMTRLWYTGSWPGLRGGAGPYLVSARAYAGALVWRAAGTPAPGTTAPGFGSWSAPPPDGIPR